jgi:predicted Fe-S protein YdhL (DUF1289 family)
MAKDSKDPCISVCKFTAEICVGCGRTKDEIRKWKKMKRSERADVVQEAGTRLKALKKAKKK